MPKLPEGATIANTDLELQARIRRGRQAKVILGDEVFRAGFKLAQTEATADLLNGDPDQSYTQAMRQGELKGTARVLDVFNRFVQDGKNVEEQQAKENVTDGA